MTDVSANTPEKEKAWKEFLPPDTFEPDWKKQFRATERELLFERHQVRATWFLIGVIVSAVLAVLVSGVSMWTAIAETALMVVALAYCGAVTALKYKYRYEALAIDKKLDRGVKLEAFEEQKA